MINSILVVLTLGHLTGVTFGFLLIDGEQDKINWIIETFIASLIIIFVFLLNRKGYDLLAARFLVYGSILIFYLVTITADPELVGFFIAFFLLPLIISTLVLDFTDSFLTFIIIMIFTLAIPLFSKSVDFRDEVLGPLSQIIVLGGLILLTIYSRKTFENYRVKTLEDERNRYFNLFQNVPVAIWEEDFTEVVRIIRTFTDVTLEEFKEYLDKNSDFVKELASKVKVIGVNKGLLSLFEAEDESQIIKALPELFNEYAYEAFKSEVLAIFKGDNYVSMESSHIDFKGKHRDVEIHWAMDDDQQTGIARVILSVIETTEKKIAEKRLRLQEEQLMQETKMKSLGSLAGGIAHDFNNILTVIIGYIDILDQSIELDPESLEFISQIRKAANRASVLIQQLLSFARKGTVEREIIDINEILNGMEHLFRRLIGEDHSITFDLTDVQLPVNVNRSQVEMIFMNLVINARDSLLKGGEIKLMSRSTKPSINDNNLSVEVTVADNGKGIEEEILPLIFDPFFTTKEKGQGTGMGLTMVYAAVKQNDGKIAVESNKNKGSTFTVSFEMAADKPEVNMNSKTEEIVPKARGGLILIVEDDEMVQSLVHKSLKNYGYDVILAKDGIEALTCYQKNPNVKIVITDIVMPNMGGLELYKELIRIKPDLPFLFISGYSETGIEINEIIDNSRHLLKKPFTMKELISKINFIDSLNPDQQQ